MIDSIFPPIQWTTEYQCFPAVNDKQRVNERQEPSIILYDKKGQEYEVRCESKHTLG